MEIDGHLFKLPHKLSPSLENGDHVKRAYRHLRGTLSGICPLKLNGPSVVPAVC